MQKRGILIYIFNIFKEGGTSRSCTNMIKELEEKEMIDKVYIINHRGVKRGLKEKFCNRHKIDENFIEFINLEDIPLIEKEFIFLITREEHFSITEETKKFKNIKCTIGEIHAPLEYIKDKYLFLENMDVIKVNTKGISDEFRKRYNYENVIYNYVSLYHIQDLEPNNIDLKETINLYVMARFDEFSKNISYLLKLTKYLLERGEKINLFLDGYGPNISLYRYLRVEYEIEDNVFINSEYKPKNLVPISSSRYETFGYSIIEGIYKYGTCLFYPGVDNNLKEIYVETNNVRYLTLDLEKDFNIVKELREKYDPNEKNYVDNLMKKLELENYVERYIEKISASQKNKKVFDPYEQANEYRILKQQKELEIKYNIMKNKVKKILPYKVINHKTRTKILNNAGNLFRKREFNKFIINENQYFIESFHGKNFSGNPKALAIEISKNDPEALIYVSSINSLVDIEILEWGFIPVRFNSFNYNEAYKKSKYVISNGNVLIELPKINGQVHIQTWHGIPLKKMIYDLNDKKERRKQAKSLKKRKKKWDYLLTAGGESTKLLKSAFNLNENSKIKILEEGMPRINYIQKVDIEKTKKKYGIDKDKKVILFSPTWRKERRSSVTDIDLLKILETLEDYIIILKIHPLESYLRKEYKNLHKRLIVPILESSDINELYAISDFLISDYSSVIFDYMYLGRPIIINQEDEEDYGKDIGFYFDLEEETGLKANNFNTEEMIKVIEDKVGKEYDYSNFIDKYTPKDRTYKEGDILKIIQKEQKH